MKEIPINNQTDISRDLFILDYEQWRLLMEHLIKAT